MRTLKVNLFYKCTAECSHCRFSCTMAQEANPDFETPYNAAKELKENFGLDVVVLLGGEPSIYAAETHRLLSRLSGLGLLTRLETNASWAGSPEEALEFLTPVKEAGTSVMLSLDGFHDPYVPYANIINALRCCMELGITCNLEIPYLNMELKDHPIDQITSKLKERIMSDIGTDIAMYEGNVIFVGRAADVYGAELAPGRGVPGDKCTSVPWWRDSGIETTELLILEPGGWVTKGCGIAIGNVHNQGIVEMVRAYNAYDNPVFSILLNEGPIGLAREAERHGYVISGDYADKCHLCYEARQFLRSSYPDIMQPDAHYKSKR